MEIGKNIARFRKERGITQEQLGQALNISGQAVSKWEKGGAPDTAMLPLIADELNVTIDALYGRPSEPMENMAAALSRWLSAVPSDKRMTELFHLLCKVTQRPYYIDDAEMIDKLIGEVVDLPAQSCYTEDFIGHQEDLLWIRSILYLSQGLQLSVPSEDCPFYLLMPEPSQGYDVNLADNRRYRELFSVLGQPGAMEILRYLYSKKEHYYFSAAISKATGISPERSEAVLSAMSEINLINQTQVETEDGAKEVYCIHNNGAFVPFLLLAKWLMEKEDMWIGGWFGREHPILQKGGTDHAPV